MPKNLVENILKKYKNPENNNHWLTRFVLLRILGLVYLFAFISLAVQVIPLIGTHGLMPADLYLENVEASIGAEQAFKVLPTIFFINASDTTLVTFSWIGILLSLLVLFGLANVPLLFSLWIIYMSFVHVGQLWYSYGWEIQLLETGFLAMFLVPFLNPKPFPKTPPPLPIIWLFRWLAFRIYVGSGLIKLRGDSCWRKLTCLYTHYETQPIPNPLSSLFHFAPKFIHNISVFATHVIMLVVPWAAWTKAKLRNGAGVIMLGFQFLLILSGNLAFLNWITIVPIIAIIDDSLWRKILPKQLVSKADYARTHAMHRKSPPIAAWVMVVLVAFLSIPVITNLLSQHQMMNTSFNRLHLVNTYGAFGSIGNVRNELIIQGTSDTTITENTIWKEYEFPGKPGNLKRHPPTIAPYQPRLDWQIWFAAMTTYERAPWTVHLVWKLLHNDKETLRLLSYNPFPDAPPKIIRIQYYHYAFSEEKNAVWERELLGTWLSPLSKDTPGLREFIASNHWKTYD